MLRIKYQRNASILRSRQPASPFAASFFTAAADPPTKPYHKRAKHRCKALKRQ